MAVDEPLDIRFEMRAAKSWVEALDDWRAAQRPVPSRAQAIRRLVEFALAAEPLGEMMALAPPGTDIGEWARAMLARLDALEGEPG